MCGIAGFYGAGDASHLQAMINTLIHRGPDDEGTYVQGALHLGHRRLAILDLQDGHQPMYDATSGAVIIYNGELYNNLELRAMLKAQNCHFKTSHSDTETILQAFLTYGSACFELFNGMFALAIYEPKQQKLWLARDRFGEKPLYYTLNAHGFAFASEIKALVKWPYFNTSINYANLQRFLGWGYLPCERTLHPNCFGLPPASWLCVNLQDLSTKIQSYWQFELTPDYTLTAKDENNLVEELRSLLIQAVKRRLVADVPVGIFLSGGLDSSSILAAATKCLNKEAISAFSIGFNEPSFDESPNAQMVANSLGVKHFIETVTIDDLFSTAPSILGNMSEPLGDASLIPTEHLAAFARKNVTVALSGDGGDELFAGYDPFKALAPAALYRMIMPTCMHKALRRTMDTIRSSDKNMSLEFKLKRVLRGLSYAKDMQLPIWMSPLEPNELKLFFEQPLTAEEIYEDALNLRAQHPKATELEQALYFFTRFYLTDDILVKVDRACMMVSLESRAVYLDNDIVAFCQKLPQHFKYHHGTRKYILRKALATWLPKNILELPKKGFGIPLNRWLRSMPDPKALAGINAKNVALAASKHRERHGDYRFFLWGLHALNALNSGSHCAK